MKKKSKINISIYILMFILVLIAKPSFSQKIVQKGEIVYVNNNPYAIVNKEKYGFRRIYKIKTLDNKLVLLITKENNNRFHEVFFVQTNEKAYISMNNIFTSYKLTRVFRQLYNDKVLLDNGINNEGKNIFLILNSKIPYDPQQYHNHLNNR